MIGGTIDWKKLEQRVAELDAQRLAWKWSPENPLPPLEAEILRVLEQLVSIYPTVTEGQRSYIRKMMQNHPGVAMYLQAVATGDVRKIRSEIPPERLYSALIAVSMADSDFGDYRDLLVLLGSLWLLAAQAGIDPAPYFESVSALSASKPHAQGEPSTRDILADFHNYAYFKEAVEPHLRS